MKIPSNSYKGSFFGVCHFEARLVKNLEGILGKIARQLIVYSTFKNCRKKEGLYTVGGLLQLRIHLWGTTTLQQRMNYFCVESCMCVREEWVMRDMLSMLTPVQLLHYHQSDSQRKKAHKLHTCSPSWSSKCRDVNTDCRTQLQKCFKGEFYERVKLMLHLQFMNFWDQKFYLTSGKSKIKLQCASWQNLFSPRPRQISWSLLFT